MPSLGMATEYPIRRASVAKYERMCSLMSTQVKRSRPGL
jgi:hypothetical protein